MPGKAKVKAKAKTKRSAKEVLTITRPKMGYLKLKLTSVTPLVQNKFSSRKQAEVMATQEGGQPAKNKRERRPKDFEREWQEALHRGPKGEYGFPAAALSQG